MEYERKIAEKKIYGWKKEIQKKRISAVICGDVVSAGRMRGKSGDTE